MSKTGTILAVALTVAGITPALAQSGGRYATDPDRFVWSQLGYEHRALAHQDAVLPPTAGTKAAKVRGSGVADGRYATDPDRFIYSQLGYEHRALAHQDAVLPQSARAQVIVPQAVPIAPSSSTSFSYDNRVRQPW